MQGFKCYSCQCENYTIRATNTQMRFGCYGHEKSIVECDKCHLVQLYPLWAKEELDALYSKYSAKKDFDGYKSPINISRYLTKYIGKKDNVLEIGCGNGDNIKWLRNKGYDVIGIDRDSTVCDNKIVFNCEFEKFKSEKGFDFIYGIHILEHVVDPVKFLNIAIDKLNDGGKLLLEIPCVEDPLISLYKNKSYHNFTWYPYHIYCYSAKTITDILNKVNNIDIKIFRKQRYGIINHLRWTLRGKPGNLNFNVPIIDNIYKFILTKILHISDTLIIFVRKVQ